MLRELLAREFPRPKESPMTGFAAPACAAAAAEAPARSLTHGRTDLDREEDRILDQVRPQELRTDPRPPPARRLLPPNSIFAFVRWAANDLRHDHLAHRHRARGSPRRAVPDAALRAPRRRHPAAIDGWPKVERVLQLIDAIEALGIDPATSFARSLAARPQPDGRRPGAARLHAERHRAWLKRRRIEP
jgi:hypothetical protein